MFRVECLGLRVESLGFRVECLGLSVGLAEMITRAGHP